MPPLKNQRHELFAQGLAEGKTADEAYQVAGFEPHRGNASRLSSNEIIRARVDELLERSAKRVEIDQAWVLSKLVENVERSMEGQVNPFRLANLGDGQTAAVWEYNGSVANKSLELIGKSRGINMFVEKVEHSGPDGGPIQVAHDLGPLSVDELKQLREIVAKTTVKS